MFIENNKTSILIFIIRKALFIQALTILIMLSMFLKFTHYHINHSSLFANKQNGINKIENS